MADEVEAELTKVCPQLLPLVQERNSAALLLEDLPLRFPVREIGEEGGRPQRAWELAALMHLNRRRPYEALAIFWSLYQHMLAAQDQGKRVHKGTPLCWIADCFQHLGYPVHAKRYLLLTLCEDAVQGKGIVPASYTGSYFRLVWGGHLSDREFQRYATLSWEQAQANPDVAKYPEAILQRVDDDWQTALPSAAEAFVYFASTRYVQWMLGQLGAPGGKALEFLADYLMSCMPGCRTRRRTRSGSTDYDVLCSMEGFEVDFRSELGRYFVCECKDWDKPADFTTMAKFCRVLDSFKARFGILFSKEGISGETRTTDAAREQLKVFQDRGIVVVVINLEDLQSVAGGKNLISFLRNRYEAVRLDIRQTQKPR